MVLKEYYWYFKKAISPSICNKICKLGNSVEEKIGTIGKPVLGKELKKTRNSNVVWLNEQWLYNLITPFFKTANKNAGWDFHFDYFESCQFTKYTSKGQHYTWHQDDFVEPYNKPNDPNFHNKKRKLSAVIFLSKQKDYKGGELLFNLKNDEEGKDRIISTKEIAQQGTMVVFPSFIWHKVTPLLKGKRYSLVIWALGNKFI